MEGQGCLAVTAASRYPAAYGPGQDITKPSQNGSKQKFSTTMKQNMWGMKWNGKADLEWIRLISHLGRPELKTLATLSTEKCCLINSCQLHDV